MKAFEFNPETDFAKYSKLLASNLTFNNVVNESRCSLDGLKGTYQVSKKNKWLHDFLEKGLGMKVEYEFKLGTFTYDLRIVNILINMNPTMSHNVTHSYRYLKGHTDDKFQFDHLHHVKQSLNALQNGMFCIHVWDWDAWEPLLVIIKGMLSKTITMDGLHITQIHHELAQAWRKDKSYNDLYANNTYQSEVNIAIVDKDGKILQMMTFAHVQRIAKIEAIEVELYGDNQTWDIVHNIKTQNIEHGTAEIINWFIANWGTNKINPSLWRLIDDEVAPNNGDVDYDYYAKPMLIHYNIDNNKYMIDSDIAFMFKLESIRPVQWSSSYIKASMFENAEWYREAEFFIDNVLAYDEDLVEEDYDPDMYFEAGIGSDILEIHDAGRSAFALVRNFGNPV